MVSTLPVALAILANRPGVTPDPSLVRRLADLVVRLGPVPRPRSGRDLAGVAAIAATYGISL